MDPVVTARVPAGIREQGNEVLASIGSTPTELVNRAYEYVIRTKRLPEAASPAAGKKRVLTSQQKQRLARSMDETTFAVPESFWAERSYKDLLAEGRRADYEALA